MFPVDYSITENVLFFNRNPVTGHKIVNVQKEKTEKLYKKTKRKR